MLKNGIKGKTLKYRFDPFVSGRYFGSRLRRSQGGIAQLTKALANEWASKGINVNAIAPGYMVTDNTAELRKDPERSRQILERIPAGRWGEPCDLAGAAVLLCSSASDYVHGHVLVVDGGWMAVEVNMQLAINSSVGGTESAWARWGKISGNSMVLSKSGRFWAEPSDSTEQRTKNS